jgi:hypothetical protein
MEYAIIANHLNRREVYGPIVGMERARRLVSIMSRHYAGTLFSIAPFCPLPTIVVAIEGAESAECTVPSQPEC